MYIRYLLLTNTSAILCMFYKVYIYKFYIKIYHAIQYSLKTISNFKCFVILKRFSTSVTIQCSVPLVARPPVEPAGSTLIKSAAAVEKYGSAQVRATQNKYTPNEQRNEWMERFVEAGYRFDYVKSMWISTSKRNRTRVVRRIEIRLATHTPG